jgi:hypothetical protein
MAENVYPTLDSVGFLTTPESKAERALSDYIGTNFSQSNVFYGSLKSMIYAVKNNTNDMAGLANQVTNDLTELYGKYLSGVVVEVQAVPTVDPDGNVNDAVYELQMDVQFLSGSIVVQLAKSIMVDNKGLGRLMTIERR